MGIWRLTIAVLFSALLPLAGALADVAGADNGALGTWATEGGKSHVEIMTCGEKLCGRIIWLKEPMDDEGMPKHDANNPDSELQSRPIIGLPLLANFIAGAEANVWDDGTIYNPEDGETYSSTMTLLNGATLKVRGYVGLPLFGKTQVWTRVN
jgi:uncharacterized protein (DUF2147 family)